MSTTRGKHTARDDADEVVITAEVPLKVAAAVQKIGTSLGVKLTLPNDPIAAAAQEVYVAKEVLKAAEGRSEAARKALMPMLKVPNAKGKHVVHDSAIANVIADQRAAPRRLSEEAVINLLAREFKCDVERAKRLVDECKLGGDAFVTHLTVVLK